MKVRAVKDFEFEIEGIKLQVSKGQEIDIPRYSKAAEWISAGLVVPVREEKIETAVRTPQERAVTR